MGGHLEAHLDGLWMAFDGQRPMHAWDYSRAHHPIWSFRWGLQYAAPDRSGALLLSFTGLDPRGLVLCHGFNRQLSYLVIMR
jgi:hypothetical protein